MPEQRQAIAVTVEKAKVGPITERYTDGEYREIDCENRDGVRRYAVARRGNKFNGDYKVAYASDPVIVVQANTETVTHDELQAALEDHDLWRDEYEPIEVPSGKNGWKAGFKSLPQSADMISSDLDQMEQAVEREHDFLGGDGGGTAYLPR